MNNICMWYDLETTGLLLPKKELPKIVQFSALFVEQKTNEVLEEVNNFQKLDDIGEYLKETNGQEYQNEVNEKGLEPEEFHNKIKELLLKYKPNAFGGHNIRDFDNLILKRTLKGEYMLMLLKQHDTRIYEFNIVGCDKFGTLRNGGGKIKTTLEACCERHDISFDANEAHDGLYDVKKSFELFLKQKILFDKKNKKQLGENNA